MVQFKLKGETLGEVGRSRDNNLDVIRFLAAFMVIFSHSFPLTMGADYSDPLSTWTDTSLSVGGIAVAVFLIMGGYLIAGSMERKKTGKAYFKARCTRIFPELIFVVVCCALIIGPFWSTYTPVEYYTNPGTWMYLLNGVFVLIHNLPGVFVTNTYPGVVNGPLWVLPLEFACYVLCFFMYRLGFFDKKRYKAFFVACALSAVVVFIAFGHNSMIVSLARPTYLFIIGVGFYLFRDQVAMDGRVALACFALMVVFIALKLDILAMLLFFPYLFLYIAFATKHTLSGFARHGEFSYGMYLWGWPIQQTLCFLTGNTINWYENALIACILSIGFGALNYFVVSKNMKKFLKRHA